MHLHQSIQRPDRAVTNSGMVRGGTEVGNADAARRVTQVDYERKRHSTHGQTRCHLDSDPVSLTFHEAKNLSQSCNRQFTTSAASLCTYSGSQLELVRFRHWSSRQRQTLSRALPAICARGIHS